MLTYGSSNCSILTRL